MKKPLTTKWLIALLWTLSLMLMPMSIMADDNTPLSVTVKKHSEGKNLSEMADKAFDGITTTKWCGDIPTALNANPFVEVELYESSKLDYYYLYTGNDINYENEKGKQQRNPKEWKLFAKVNEGDEWTEISHVTDAQLPTTVSTRSDNYRIDAAYRNTQYKYLRFEILQVEQGDIFEVGEICLINRVNHSGELVVEEPATCTEPGRKAYRDCPDCGKRVDVNGNELTDDDMVIPALGHTFNDDLKCTVCGHEIGKDCIIEYTATQRLRYEEKDSEEVFDYTDNFTSKDGTENLGYHLFGAEAIQHEYDETTQKGRIVFSTPVERFDKYSKLHHEYLTSITLPSTVKYIAGDAFYECRNLTTITLRAEDVENTNYLLPPFECNNLREIFVPYISYNEYMEKYGYKVAGYEDEDGEEYYVIIKDILKSLLTLDDTQAFQSPTNEVKVDATLQRSFANDGWYSLCLPFSVSVADSPFAQVAAFNELAGNTYRFTTVDNIEAGKAYIVKVNEAVANPTFKNVIISTAAPATDGEFIGVYSPTELGEGCKVIGSGTTVNPVNPGTMKGYRAYFPASAANTKAMRFTVDDGEATVVQSPIEAEGYKLKATGTFNLAGQKVNENYRGIVIKNGKKLLRK